MPTERSVMLASVVSGGISDHDPTNAVLQEQKTTPKPPAMTIFTRIGARSSSALVAPTSSTSSSPSSHQPSRSMRSALGSAGPESTQQPLEDGALGSFRARDVDSEVAVGREVRDD